jgi:predicted alpha/beta superfamily hydrolase
MTPYARGRIGLCAALIGMLPGLAGSQQVAVGPRPHGRTPVVLGEAVTLHSEILDEDRTLLINVAGGDAEANPPLPVIYVLDGGVNFHLTTATVDNLTRNGRMPRSMVVGITNVDRVRDFTAVRRDGRTTGGAERFLDFFASELVPFIDANYSTAPHRTLIGHSLGGLFVVHTMAERPGLFDAAIAISPALTNDERVGRGTRPISERLQATLNHVVEEPFALMITMSDGEDPRANTDLDILLAVLRASAPADLRWEYRLMEGEDHGTTVLPSTAAGLRFIHAAWDTSRIMRSGTAADLIGRFELMSETLGVEVLPPEEMVNLLGYRLLGTGRVEDAIEAFEVNVGFYPSSANVHDSLGEALERSGRLPGALRCYRRAVALADAADDPLASIYEANLERVEATLFAAAERDSSPLERADPGGP